MLFTIGLNSWWWRILEDYVYVMPQPPPRKRTKPMEVLCVGMPRTGTESLQQALMILGYDHTYHGFDIPFEEESRMPRWVSLCRKKWYGDMSGDAKISAQEFDEFLGHCTAVTDTAASSFAPELIAAYPEAKVVLNMRHDLDSWHESVINTILKLYENNFIYLFTPFQPELWWAWHLFMRFLVPAQFRALERNNTDAVRRNGKWVYREHCNMIRGLVPKERLLEWYIGDGWEPLCKFLDKPIPDVPFPHSNATGKGWQEREKQISDKIAYDGVRNVFIGVTLPAVLMTFLVKRYR